MNLFVHKTIKESQKTTYTFFSLFVLHLGTRATVLSKRLTFVLGRSSMTATSFLKDPLVNMATYNEQVLYPCPKNMQGVTGRYRSDKRIAVFFQENVLKILPKRFRSALSCLVGCPKKTKV